MANLPLAWTQHTRDPKEKEQVENSLRNSFTMKERLLDIIDKQLQQLDAGETNYKDFEDGSWPYKAAFRAGNKKGLIYIKELLSFDRNESI